MAVSSKELPLMPKASSRVSRSSDLRNRIGLLTILAFSFLVGRLQALPGFVGDLDKDGRPSSRDIVLLVNHLTGVAPLAPELMPFADVNQDGIVNDQDADALANAVLGLRTLGDLPATTIRRTSPTAGESDVAVTRETVVYFTQPVSPATTITTDRFYAEFGGQKLLARTDLSSDRRKATLFYLEPLPGGSRVRVTLDTDGLLDAYGRAVDGDGDGQPGGVFEMDFDTLSLTTLEGTAVIGRVFASELAPGGSPDQSVNVPLEGVTITLDGMEQTVRAVTDTLGNFRLEPVPAGEFFVHIDGRTVGTYDPTQAYYPFVGKKWRALPGVETSVGNIYLPLVAAGTLQTVSPVEETEITFPAAVLSEYPELSGVSVTVPANSLVSDSGIRGGRVGLAPVPPDRLPAPLPPGLEVPLVITVQTDGPSNFDQPVPICFPNLPDPDTGEVLPPGAKSALWSFNHDTGRWEIAGPMTVSADGRTICTDPGVGILQPGWHTEDPGVDVDDDGTGTGGGSDGDEEPPNGQPEDATDPVYLFSGEYYCSEEDLRVTGRGFDFTWMRKYRSKIGQNTVQGNGWDYSYNIRLEAEGNDLVLFNGQSRSDRYVRQTDGSYSSDGFFRDLARNGDASFTLTFEDTTRWEFLPLNGQPGAGRISANMDRNGNTMRFIYDGAGRLERVRDTLDRDFLVSYNAQGLIASVTDFIGRTVRYQYYDGVEPGGNLGDLKSVTTPSVVGTPHGNDFPQGKTRSYTYSTDEADDRLNHNLLTVTDGRRNDPGDATSGAGPYLINVYSPETDPNHPDFDRVIRQIWGGDVVDMLYMPLLPSLANGGAVMRTILNDRNGNVKEYFYDAQNHMVRKREYTGRANPTAPTTALVNRPADKLRATDPDYFETRYEWNEDSLEKRVIHPNGNILEYVYESDLNPNAAPRTRANLRILRQLPGTHQPAGDQVFTEERYDYDSRFGGASYITRIVDARGNATVYTYDDRGNRVRIQNKIGRIIEDFEYNAFGQLTARVNPDNGSGHRRRDAFTYYDSGPQRGYLQAQVIDATEFGLTTAYEYDAVGNVVRATDPRGNDTQYMLNALDQVVREISREVAAGTGVRYQRDQFYDANNNLARVNIQNVDENGVPQPNTHITVSYDYEILNKPIRVTEEVDAATAAVEEYAYDGNRNRVLTRYGEAVSGNQPSNARQTLYDERDLEFRVVRAPGDAARSTTQYDYDGNGNIVTVWEGLEDQPRRMSMVYDGYNRVVSVIDPLGNVQHSEYDPNDNRVRLWFEGEVTDVPGSADNVLLSDVRYTFDAMNRLVRTDSAFFDTATQESLTPAVAVGQVFYNDHSQIVRVVDANGHEERRVYDTAGRSLNVIDAKANLVEYAYDANDNVVAVTEVEKSDLAEPDEAFVTTFEYDGLDREIKSTDSAGNVHEYAYDSRDNLRLEVDAQRTAPDQPGNVTRYDYDGINRLIRSTTTLTADGTGSSAPVSEVELNQTWDASTRLKTQTDPNGNTTTYTYDGLNRQTGIAYADGTSIGQVFDVHDKVVERTDANGSVSTTTYDLLNRRVRSEIMTDPGVAATTTFEAFQYDGLSRIVRAEDDDSIVTRGYDSFSRVLVETQNGRAVASQYDPVGNMLAGVYPGGRIVQNTYDELDRKMVIQDQQGLIASYDYVGANRVRRRDYGNGTRAEYAYDGQSGALNPPNDFGVKRVIQTAHTRIANGAIIDNRTYTWDRMFNKTSRDHGGIVQQFNYDSLYRLVQSTISSGGTLVDNVQYELDAAGNRVAVSGGAEPGSYAQDLSEPGAADAQVNQYTSTPTGVRQYDDNGNLKTIGAGLLRQRDLAYDYRNQMVEHVDGDSGVRTTYAYDVFGRRISKSVEDGANISTTHYVYMGWQVCEEQDDVGTTTATYVYGNYLDEVVNMQRAGADYFYHTDDQLSVVSVTDANGDVVEEYFYEDFGRVEISDATGFPRARSAIGNPYMFTGRRLDSETGFYYYRTRYYDVSVGRFITRDTIGIWGDPANLGNGFTYVGNNPWTLLDPFGLDQGEQSVFGAAVSGFFEGLGGGASILTNTFTFGGSDKIGLTNSNQYQGRAYDAARVTAVVSREALLTALSGGANAARGGACMLQGMGRLAPLISKIQAAKHGPKIASLIHKIVEAVNTGRDLADLIAELRKITKGNGSLFNAIMSALGALSGMDALRSAPGFCFAEGTEVLTPEGFVAIEVLEVGDRVVTDDDVSISGLSRLEFSEWRRVQLEIAEPDGRQRSVDVELLCPEETLTDVGCRVGAELRLEFPEIGLSGWARVVSIVPRDPRPGPGRLVLGTIRSWSDCVIRLHLAESGRTLDLTPQHPLFSATHVDWVPAGEVVPGEQLRTRSGLATIAAVTAAPGRQPVYNLQVDTTRTFFVTGDEVLSHNAKYDKKAARKALQEARQAARRQASETGAALVTEYKRSGVGQAAGRSGGHGAPHKRAGAELIRRANRLPSNSENKALKAALKLEGQSLIEKGKAISHRGGGNKR